MKTRVMIVVDGGNVQEVLSDNPDKVNVQIFDIDNLKTTGLSGNDLERIYQETAKKMKKCPF